MPQTISLTIPDIYIPPTDDDLKTAKQWTILRNRNATTLSGLVEALLKDALSEIVAIAYKYNVKPEEFQFSQNQELQAQVYDIMDELEDNIMALVEEYALNESEDKDRKTALLPWLLALKAKNTSDLRSTLEARLRQWLYDTEAQIAAMKMAGYNKTKALTRITSTMHAVYSSPEIMSAYRKNGQALYLQSRGVHQGNIGLSSSGEVNVENFASMTAIMAWNKSLFMEYQDRGAAAYVVMRGSNYPCDLCDSHVGVWPLEDESHFPPQHGHCCCTAMPLFRK